MGHPPSIDMLTVIENEARARAGQPGAEGAEAAAAELAALVADNALFAALPSEARDELCACLTPQWVEDGAYLFHAGQHADRLYLVASGELEVLSADAGAADRLNLLGAGALVGELAVLRGGVRSASVRARGRTLLYQLSAADFTRLVHRWPALAVAVARRVASFFVQSERSWRGEVDTYLWCVHESLPWSFVEAMLDALPRTLPSAAEAELQGAAPRRVLVLTRDALARQAARDRPIALTKPKLEIRVETLDLETLRDPSWYERDHEAALILVYGGQAELAPALPRAEALVVTERAREAFGPHTGAGRRIVIAREGLPTRDRIKARAGAPVERVAPRVVRSLLRQSVGLALGGGAALGFAHVGVLEALERMGVEVDFIHGTSMGAVVGAAYLGLGATELRRRVELMRRPVDWMKLVDPSVVTSGVLSGKRAHTYLTGLIERTRFEQLDIPFAAVALDIDAAEERVLSEGSLIDAVRASMSIPGVVMPHRYDSPFGRARYVDGCMINNVPVDSVRAMGADRVIGVHVIGRDPVSSAGQAQGGRRWIPRVPGTSSVIRLADAAQTYLVAMARSGERQVYMADVGILPDTAGIGLWEMWRGCEIADRGREATERAADRLALFSA